MSQPAAVSGATGQKSPGEGPIQVVEFLLGSEHFAIDLFDVKEVVEYTRITRLPNSQHDICGIIDLRGEITTIFDLGERLNARGPGENRPEGSRIIILDNCVTGSKVGILVDDVTSVSTFERTDVDNASVSVAGEQSAVLGIIRRRGRVRDRDVSELIIWIDIRQLLGNISRVDPGRTAPGAS